MHKIDRQQFYSVGYFLIRADHPGWEGLKQDGLPDKLMSLSEHICPNLNLTWGWQPGDKDAALRFGIAPDKLDEFIAWCGGDYMKHMDIWNMIYSPDDARQITQRFIENTDDLFLIGVGFPAGIGTSHFEPPKEPHQESYSIEKRLLQHLPLELGGKEIGFDVASLSGFGGFGCSWLCSGLHKDMRELFGIHTGQYGLLQSEADARKIYEWIAEDNMQGHRAEPEPYAYWLLVAYPLDIVE